jgi:hypothetical protein
MKTIVIVNIVVFIIAVSIAMYIELNPKKWQTWLLGLYGFLSFLLLGLVGKAGLYESIMLGAVGVAMVVGGIITYQNRERAKKWLKEHSEDEE